MHGKSQELCISQLQNNFHYNVTKLLAEAPLSCFPFIQLDFEGYIASFLIMSNKKALRKAQHTVCQTIKTAADHYKNGWQTYSLC